jgi:penicillin amidase
MNKLLAIGSVFLTILLIYFLNNPVSTSPAFGKLLSPNQGFWNNSVSPKLLEKRVEYITTPSGNKVSVYYDEKLVPHLYAQNEDDLYFAQGYVVAKDRLWQMEFQTMVAAGRLTEIVGEKALDLDRYHRRIGMAKAAEESVRLFEVDNYAKVANAFTDGVNHYINKLKPSQLPLEYKLLGYKPEPWSIYKSALLMKFMANDLTGSDNDIEFTNALNMLGRDIFDIVHPLFPQHHDPIIPIEHKWEFTPKTPKETLQLNLVEEEILHSHLYKNPKNIGSNNWAISAQRTANGAPILCNDPHLNLRFPSIWYELQLSTPEFSTYGVTIPGAPGIVLGFNNDIAWGVTNGAWDVRDWYQVELNPDNKDMYKVGEEYHSFEKRVEIYKIKNGIDKIDTVLWTFIGPIVYDKTFGEKEDEKMLALHWEALNPSIDAKTFYLLNKAKNHQDYLAALEYFSCPSQNFVYADKNNNIAIKERGNFITQHPDEGRFVGQLANYNQERMYDYIPSAHNPYVLNPDRGFVSSANQHPTDDSYPYYYNGVYEYYRNRRINDELRRLEKATIEDMMRLQNDNFYLLAKETLPYMLGQLNLSALSSKAKAVIQLLSKWDYFAEFEKKEPTYFQMWWDNIMTFAWDEFKSEEQTLVYPEEYTTSFLLMNQPDFQLFDNKSTEEVENAQQIIQMAFDKMIEDVQSKQEVELVWQNFKNSGVRHLAQIKAFSSEKLPIGGHGNCVNAAGTEAGPSWRIIVEMGKDEIKAYGIYPGGQSGNPAHPYYDQFIDKWAKGEYYPINFFTSEDQAKSYINKTN